MTPTYADYIQFVAQQDRTQYQQPVAQPILSYVANRTAADLFNVNPGQSAILIDMDNPFVYRKSRGTDGKLLPLEIYDLVAHSEPVIPSTMPDMDCYVKREDIDRIVAEEVDKRITEAFSKPVKRKTEDKT